MEQIQFGSVGPHERKFSSAKINPVMEHPLFESQNRMIPMPPSKVLSSTELGLLPHRAPKNGTAVASDELNANCQGQRQKIIQRVGAGPDLESYGALPHEPQMGIGDDYALKLNQPVSHQSESSEGAPEMLRQESQKKIDTQKVGTQDCTAAAAATVAANAVEPKRPKRRHQSEGIALANKKEQFQQESARESLWRSCFKKCCKRKNDEFEQEAEPDQVVKKAKSRHRIEAAAATEAETEQQKQLKLEEAEALMQQQQAAKVCSLCNRETPLYFYQQREVASRMTSKSQTKLIKQMREDILSKSRGKYLMYVRVTGSFVLACRCEKAPVHSYCITAQVIRSRRIYCERCDVHYNLYIRQESICNNRLMSKLFSYILLTVMLIVGSGLGLVLDGYLKFLYFKRHPELVEETKERLSQQEKLDGLSFGYVPQYFGEEFDFFTGVSWVHLYYMIIVIVLFIGKCFFERIQQVIMENDRFISVEVLSFFGSRIDRKQAKKNLRQVVKKSEQRKSLGSLYDQAWYLRRGVAFTEISSETAFCMDKWDGECVLNPLSGGHQNQLVGAGYRSNPNQFTLQKPKKADAVAPPRRRESSDLIMRLTDQQEQQYNEQYDQESNLNGSNVDQQSNR